MLGTSPDRPTLSAARPIWGYVAYGPPFWKEVASAQVLHPDSRLIAELFVGWWLVTDDSSNDLLWPGVDKALLAPMTFIQRELSDNG